MPSPPSAAESLSPLSFQNAASGTLRSKSVWANVRLTLNLSKPYFYHSRAPSIQLIGVLLLSLAASALSVTASYLSRDFWNSLSSRNAEAFWLYMAKYFLVILFIVPVIVLVRYSRDKLAADWRNWLTSEIMEEYCSFRCYYWMEINKEIDNPDQRIAEDIKSFTAVSLRFIITLFTTFIDLVAFTYILFSIDRKLFTASVLYSMLGTYFTVKLGRNLIALNFIQLQKEGDFRYSLVRLRDNSESVAFYGGELVELKGMQKRMRSVVGSIVNVIAAERTIELFTTAYRFVIQVLPAAIVAPRYFAGSVQLGVISQSYVAFNHILSDLSLVINQFEAIAAYSAGLERLGQFVDALHQCRKANFKTENIPTGLRTSSAFEGALSTHEVDPYASMGDLSATKLYSQDILEQEKFNNSDEAVVHLPLLPENSNLHGKVEETGSNELINSIVISGVALEVKDLTVRTPDAIRILIANLSFKLNKGDRLLIVGNSGSGKSSLLRALSGLWINGSGAVIRPTPTELLFLPQKPYCSLGTLRDQLLYPQHAVYPQSTQLDSQLLPTAAPPSHIISHLDVKQSEESTVWTDQMLLSILEKVQLKTLAEELQRIDVHATSCFDIQRDWASMLSMGEQQRVAFARLLIHSPKLVIMDESTSALDTESEQYLYGLLQNSKDLTYISVGHRPSLRAYHNRCLRLHGGGGFTFENISHGYKEQEETALL